MEEEKTGSLRRRGAPSHAVVREKPNTVGTITFTEQPNTSTVGVVLDDSVKSSKCFDSIDACDACRSRWKAEAAGGAKPSKDHFSLCEVQQHKSADSCWLIAHGKVYDVTKFIPMHPGGMNSIIKHGGTVADVDFDFHSRSAQHLWDAYKIGTVRYCDALPKPSTCAIM